MDKKILDTIKKHKMLRSKSVIVALSGGADSMALLYFFYKYKKALNIDLKALHLNHNIRGEDALADENFVKGYCESLNIPLHLFSKDIPRLASENKESLEECGRRIRYELLHSLDDSSMIATGHHLDDSAETAIFNLARGSGLAGLSGIPPRRGRIIRPLIECEKAEILAYCEQNSIPYQTDITNLDTVFVRNKIRLEIMPLLKDLNPSFLQAFLKNADILTASHDYIKGEAKALVEKAKTADGYRADVLNQAHSAVKNEAVLQIAESFAKTTCSYNNVKAVLHILENGGSAYIANGKILTLAQNILKEVDYIEDFSQPGDIAEIFIEDFDKTYLYNKKSLTFTDFDLNVNKGIQKINNKLFINLIDCDKINGRFILRSRKAGDFVRLYGRNCTKSLKKLFNESKVPQTDRASTLILTDDEGIVWLEGFGVSERCSLGAQTKKALKIVVNKN